LVHVRVLFLTDELHWLAVKAGDLNIAVIVVVIIDVVAIATAAAMVERYNVRNHHRRTMRCI